MAIRVVSEQMENRVKIGNVGKVQLLLAGIILLGICRVYMLPKTLCQLELYQQNFQ